MCRSHTFGLETMKHSSITNLLATNSSNKVLLPLYIFTLQIQSQSIIKVENIEAHGPICLQTSGVQVTLFSIINKPKYAE